MGKPHSFHPSGAGIYPILFRVLCLSVLLSFTSRTGWGMSRFRLEDEQGGVEDKQDGLENKQDR
jgi:hypothetical protein